MLAKVTRGLVAEFDPEKIYLFEPCLGGAGAG